MCGHPHQGFQKGCLLAKAIDRVAAFSPHSQSIHNQPATIRFISM
jgi:hypothetical protein